MEINCDVGELTREIDDAILPFVDACNVCCGAHAGDESLIRGTIREAVRLGVAIGAHPSWPDRENFGRRSMEMPLEKLRSSLHDQIVFVKSIAEEEGGHLQHVKPHGALYHDVISNPELADCLAKTVRSFDPDLKIYGMAASSLEQTYAVHGTRLVHEAFGDRRYDSRTSLRSRRENDSLIQSESAFRQHMKKLLSGSVEDIDGQIHSLPTETICIHSDTPNAVVFAKIARELSEA